MALESMRDLLLTELKDIYSAEKQIIQALPQTIEQVESAELAEALSKHLDETKKQLKRLDQIGKIIGVKLDGEMCPAMAGLLREVQDRMREGQTGAVLDAAVISACQRVEHYEIAAYGSARTFASLERQEDIVALLEETLAEEWAADEKLSDIAFDSVNEEAEEEDGEYEEEDESEFGLSEEEEEEDVPAARPGRRG